MVFFEVVLVVSCFSKLLCCCFWWGLTLYPQMTSNSQYSFKSSLKNPSTLPALASQVILGLDVVKQLMYNVTSN